MVKRNIAWGISWGLYVAAVYSLVAALSTVIRLTATHASFVASLKLLALAFGIYIFGAIVGGTIVGLLRPCAKNWFGAVFVGIVAGTPITLGGLLSVAGLDKFGFPLLAASIVVASIWSIIAVSIAGDGARSKVE